MRRVSLLILVLLWLCGISHSAEGVRAEGATDKGAIYIGERVTLTVTVYARPDVKVEFPEINKTLGQFAVKGKRDLSRASEEGGIGYSRSYALTSYVTGALEIPALDIKYRASGAKDWQAVKTQAVKITVKSLLADNPKASDIRDIKGILLIGKNPLIFMALGTLALVLTALIIILVRRFLLRKRRAPPKSPHVLAYEELERIRMSGLVAEGRVKEYYARLSDCIRRYLEGRFGLRAPEMTTEEFLAAVRDSGTLNDLYKGLLKEFLSSSDMVKFARYGPDREEIESSYLFAKKFVDETKEEVKPVSGTRGRT